MSDNQTKIIDGVKYISVDEAKKREEKLCRQLYDRVSHVGQTQEAKDRFFRIVMREARKELGFEELK